MTEPLVSILIPCYNARPWLRAALDSALAQTWRRCEIILVDDGSTDGSLALARDYIPRGVIVVTQPNRGAGAARNHARRLARGSYLQYLDADDLLLPDKVERQLRLYATPAAAGCVISGEWARFCGDPATATAVPDGLWCDLDPVTWQVRAHAGNLMMHPAAWLVPRALSDAAGEWNESLTLNDDGEYFARVRFASRRILFCPGARSLYRSGLPGSLSHPGSPAAIASSLHSLELIQALLLGRETSARTRRACADAWMHLAFAAVPVAEGLAVEAARRAALLGGSHLRPPGGRLFRAAAALFGWRRACRWRGQRARRRRDTPSGSAREASHQR